MVTVSLQTGNVMDILTVWMVQMSITGVHPGPALLLFSSVIMATASTVLGSVMVTMTAGIWVMRETVPHSPSGALVGSGNVQATAFVWTWAKYVTILQTARMELMNRLFVVSDHLTYILAYKSWCVIAAWILDTDQRNLGSNPWSATKHNLAFHYFDFPPPHRFVVKINKKTYLRYPELLEGRMWLICNVLIKCKALAHNER